MRRRFGCHRSTASPIDIDPHVIKPFRQNQNGKKLTESNCYGFNVGWKNLLFFGQFNGWDEMNMPLRVGRLAGLAKGPTRMNKGSKVNWRTPCPNLTVIRTQGPIGHGGLYDLYLFLKWTSKTLDSTTILNCIEKKTRLFHGIERPSLVCPRGGS
jgi:hypothetical protein